MRLSYYPTLHLESAHHCSGLPKPGTISASNTAVPKSDSTCPKELGNAPQPVGNMRIGRGRFDCSGDRHVSHRSPQGRTRRITRCLTSCVPGAGTEAEPVDSAECCAESNDLPGPLGSTVDRGPGRSQRLFVRDC